MLIPAAGPLAPSDTGSTCMTMLERDDFPSKRPRALFLLLRHSHFGKPASLLGIILQATRFTISLPSVSNPWHLQRHLLVKVRPKASKGYLHSTISRAGLSVQK